MAASLALIFGIIALANAALAAGFGWRSALIGGLANAFASLCCSCAWVVTT